MTGIHLQRIASLWYASVIGSIVMVLLGVAITGLGMLPSDAPRFFLLLGLHVVAGGAGSVSFSG